MKPTVSFICASYNHERFVKKFIASIANQTIPDWELVIVDDGSSDGNAAAIRECLTGVGDGRIKFIEHGCNKGMANAFNSAFAEADADYVVICGSDDEFLPHYAETVVNAFRQNPDVGAVYCNLEKIDEDSRLIGKRFEIPYGSSAEDIFARLFLESNDLPSPGAAFRRDVLAKAMPMQNGFLQCADAEINLKVAFDNRISIIKDGLVLYREVEGSAGSRSERVKQRQMAETICMMDEVAAMIGNSPQMLLRHFGGNDLLKGVDVIPETVGFWLGRLALTGKEYSRRLWGLMQVVKAMGDEKTADILLGKYGFTFKDLLGLSACLEEKIPYYKKYRRYSKWMRILLVGSGVFLLIAITALWLFLQSMKGDA